jgi:ribosomal protein S7
LKILFYLQYYKNLLFLLQKKIYFNVIRKQINIIKYFFLINNLLHNFIQKFFNFKKINLFLRVKSYLKIKIQIKKLYLKFFFFSSIQQEQLHDLKINRYKLYIFELMKKKKLISKKAKKIFNFSKKFARLQKLLTISESQLLKFKLEEQKIKNLIQQSYKQIIFFKKRDLYFYKKIFYKYFNLINFNIIFFYPSQFQLLSKILKKLSLIVYQKFFNIFIFTNSFLYISELLKLFSYIYKISKKFYTLKKKKNYIILEPFYNSFILSKFLNSITHLGKKNIIINYFYLIFFYFKKIYKQQFLFLLIKILLFLRNPLYIKPYRKSGRLLFYPQRISNSRQIKIAFVTISNNLFKQYDNLFINKILFEFFNLIVRKGFTMNKYYEILIAAKAHLEKIYTVRKWWYKIPITTADRKKRYNKKKYYYIYKQ